MDPRPQPLARLAALSGPAPFIGPEELERRLGRRFRARLGANESVFGPSPRAIEAMRRQAEVGHWYGDPTAYDLRSAIAAQVGGTIQNVVIGPGIDGLLMHVVRAFADPSRTVVSTLGGYPTFEYAVQSVGARSVHAPYLPDGPDLESLARLADQARPAVVYVANPDNPSGAWRTPTEMIAFRQSLPPTCLLAIDEAYHDFAPDAPSFDLSDLGVIRFRTFSKAHGLAGLRVGYALGAPETLAILERVRGHFEVSSVAQAGALASLEDPDHVADVVRRTEDGRAELDAILGAHGFRTRSTATNFTLVETESAQTAQVLLDHLADHGVFVRKPSRRPFDHLVRITIGRQEEHAMLAEALASR